MSLVPLRSIFNSGGVLKNPRVVLKMTSTNTVGLFANFDHQQQDWSIYKNRLNQWFIANNIDDTADKAGVKRRAVLLSAFSENTYQLATNLALPGVLEEKSYKDVVKILDDHFTPKRCVFAERFHFYAASQRTGETPAQWAARLRGLAAHCSFQHVQDALLDKFVMGLASGPEREKLFSQDASELTLAKAIDLAESVRCARAAASAIAAPATPAQNADSLFKIGNSSSSGKDCAKCQVCGSSNHQSNKCKFASYKCQKCKKKGHLRRMCNSFKYMESGEVSEDDDGELFNIRSVKGAPMSEVVVINGLKLRFEIDSGSSVTAISSLTYKSHFKDVPLLANNKRLIGYTGGVIKSLGMVKLPITYGNRTEVLYVQVIENGGNPILGRDFLSMFNLEIAPIKFCGQSEPEIVKTIMSDYADIFSNKLGCFNKYKIKLHLKDNAKPVFFKSRPVAFALQQKVNDEITRLVQLGILEQIDHSEYASPIVPVLKRDGSVRICADYSQTINKQLLIDKYPLPTVDELFSKLHGGEQFTKLDMSMAYNQFPIEDPENITCINTIRGLFRYNRLIFGLSNSPAIFQRALNSILADIEGVLCFLDDVLITGRDKVEHESRLREVLQRFKNAGLILQRDKCAFFQDDITYLGHVINKHGINKSRSKVEAILESPAPTNVSQLQSFLGLANYYRRFVPHASTILSPLYNLLKKDTKWVWTDAHDAAFIKIKESLGSEQVLTHFNPKATLILTVDASPQGLGAILSQVGDDGSERPISYASRTLSSAEKNYAQIQKEATAIIFGVKKYHQYLYARSEPFVLRTDHKPLLSIFGPQRGIPEITANRLQRYAIFLSAYNYIIEYVRSGNNSADFLSRASLPDRPAGSAETSASAATDDRATYINFVLEGSSLPVTVDKLRLETRNDETLNKVIQHVQNGWPRKTNDLALKPYHQCRYQLSFDNGCVMRGHKLVIPQSLQRQVMNELHNSHFGVVKTKAEARARFWFPGIDARIEQLIGACAVCAQLRPSPPRAPMSPWKYPTHSFMRVHIDFVGPVNEHTYLVIVDAYSKWVECYDMKNNITSIKVIEKMYDFMSRFGIPHTIVSDNGTSFISSQFKLFCDTNGITHLTSPVYHPASNGQAESYTKIIKKGIKSSILASGYNKNVTNNLLKYLFDYRNSQHSTTGHSPASLVFGRQLRTRLDLLKPQSSPSSTELASTVKNKQCSQLDYYGGTSRTHFVPNEGVLYKSYINKNKFCWRKGCVIKRIGRLIYLIRDDITQETVKRHLNQILKNKTAMETCTDISIPISATRDNLHHKRRMSPVSGTPPLFNVPMAIDIRTELGGEEIPIGSGIDNAAPPSPAPSAGPLAACGPSAPAPSAPALSECAAAAPLPPVSETSLSDQNSATTAQLKRDRPKVNYKPFF